MRAFRTILPFLTALACSNLVHADCALEKSSEFSYDVGSYEDLKLVGVGDCSPAANYHQIHDIDASASATENDGKGFIPIQNFSGSYEGDGHVILHLTINRPTEDNVGMFAQNISGTIQYLGLIEAAITGRNNVGALIGLNEGNASYCFSHNSVIAGELITGGLAGQSSGSLSHCYARNGAVKSNSSYAGGLAGHNTGSLLEVFAFNEVFGNNNSGAIIGMNEGTGDLCYWDSTTELSKGVGSGTSLCEAVTSDELKISLNAYSDTSGWIIQNNKVVLYRLYRHMTIWVENINKGYDGKTLAISDFKVHRTGEVYIDSSRVQGYITGDAIGAKDAGTYTITPVYSSPNADDGYGIIWTLMPGTVKIDKQVITVVVPPNHKYVGNEDPPFQLQYNGFVNGEDESTLDSVPIISRAAGEMVGNYPLSMSTVTAKNYIINYALYSFSILPINRKDNELQGTYAIRAQHSKLYLGFNNSSEIVQDTSLQNDSNQWDFAAVDSIHFLITNHSNGLALSTQDTSDSQLILSTPNPDSFYQQWKLMYIGEGLHKIVNRLSKRTLDVEMAYKTPGASVLQWHSHDGLNQQWLLIAIPQFTEQNVTPHEKTADVSFKAEFSGYSSFSHTGFCLSPTNEFQLSGAIHYITTNNDLSEAIHETLPDLTPNQYYTYAPFVVSSDVMVLGTPQSFMTDPIKLFFGKEITLSKTYDRTSVFPIPNVTIDGIDSLFPIQFRIGEAIVDDPSVGTNKPIWLSYDLIGEHANKYTFGNEPIIKGNITKAPLSIVVSDAQKSQSAKDPSFTFKLLGLIPGDKPFSSVTDVELYRDPGTAPGKYAIHFSGQSKNYELKVEEGTLTITKSTTNLSPQPKKLPPQTAKFYDLLGRYDTYRP